MASSVASAKEMERWAKERKEKAQRTVPVNQEARKNFGSFKPNFDELANFEHKVQRLAERQEDREQQLEVIPVINVMGSTAGAGSGDFHTYRGYRTKEMARQADFERERKLEQAQKKWEEERAEAAAEVEAKHEKNAKKRDKKKEKRKAAIEADRSAREAKRAAREAEHGGPAASSDAGQQEARDGDGDAGAADAGAE